MQRPFPPDMAAASGKKQVLIYGRFHTTSCIFIHVLAHLLKEEVKRLNGFHFHLLLDDRRDESLVRSLLPAEQVTLHLQYKSLRPHQANGSWSSETIRRWEKSYGDPHLKSYILMERALEGRPEDARWRYLFSHIDYFENLYQKIRPAAYISGTADGLSPWVAMNVMRRNGVRFLSFSPSRFGSQAFLLDNPHEILHVGPAYRQLRRDGLSPQEREAASELLQEYRMKALKPRDHLAVRMKHRLRGPVPNPLSAIRLLKESFFTDTGIFDLPFSVAVRRALCARRTWFYNRLFSGSRVKELPPGEKFFFFPLQYEPEISLATQGRGWINQLELVKLIRDSLPIDRWLYVKEHPSMLPGIRPFRFYRELARLPRVRILPQFMDSYQIVPKAEAVLTITGTAGWEALMFNRPVVLFGHSFYEEFEEGVLRLDKREDLPQILLKIRHHRIPEEATLAYIAAVLTKTCRGLFIEPRHYHELGPEVLGADNIEGIGRAMLEALPT